MFGHIAVTPCAVGTGPIQLHEPRLTIVRATWDSSSKSPSRARMATLRRLLSSRGRISLSFTPTVHYHTTQVIRPRWPARGRRFLFTFGGGIVGASALAFISSPAHLETLHQYHDESSTLEDESLLKLLRAYVVYTACAIPSLVDNSPTIFSAVQSIPIVRQISGLIVKYTFFDHVRNSRSSNTQRL